MTPDEAVSHLYSLALTQDLIWATKGNRLPPSSPTDRALSKVARDNAGLYRIANAAPREEPTEGDEQ
jgi:hypothetical protein